MNRRSLIPDERDEHPPGLPQVRPALEGEYAVRGPNRALPELRHALRRPVAIGGRRPAQIEPRRRSSRRAHDLANSGSSDAIFAPLEDAVVPVHVTPVVDPPAAPPPLPPLEAPPRRPTADGPPCPECSEPMAGEAVVCLVCGFNRTTGKRLKTVSHRLMGRWDTGNFPLLARLIVCLGVVAACCLPLLDFGRDPEKLPVLLLLPIGGAAFGALVLGTFHRVIVTTDPQGTPILIQQLWICFVPAPRQTTDLTDFRTIRLTHRAGKRQRPGAAPDSRPVRAGRRDGHSAAHASAARATCTRWKWSARLSVEGEPFLEPLTVYHGRERAPCARHRRRSGADRRPPLWMMK